MCIRDRKIPLSYVNAFAKPVSRYSTQIVKDSTDRLAQEEMCIRDSFTAILALACIALYLLILARAEKWAAAMH